MPSPAAFAVHFHMHVWPDLAERAKVNATLIVCGLLTFAEGSDELMQIAVQRGAPYCCNSAMLAGSGEGGRLTR